MRLGRKQLFALQQFGEQLGGGVQWQWGDWHRAEKSRRADGLWPIMRSLVQRELMEVKWDEEWRDCIMVRTTEAGRIALSLSKGGSE